MATDIVIEIHNKSADFDNTLIASRLENAVHEVLQDMNITGSFVTVTERSK